MLWLVVRTLTWMLNRTSSSKVGTDADRMPDLTPSVERDSVVFFCRKNAKRPPFRIAFSLNESLAVATAMDGRSADFAGAKICLLSHGGEEVSLGAKRRPTERQSMDGLAGSPRRDACAPYAYRTMIM